MYEYEYDIDPRTQGGKSGCVTLKKGKQNLIGISIGGGSPLCPCLYIVQVFDNTPASKINPLDRRRAVPCRTRNFYSMLMSLIMTERQSLR